MRPISRFLELACHVLGGVAAAALGLAATLVMLGTVMRYAFQAPIGWSVDMTGYLFLLMIFLSLPILTLRGMHVAIDLLLLWVPPGMQRGLQRGIDLISALTLGVMAWVVLGSTMSAWRGGLGTAAGLSIPRWWLLAVICFSFAFAALIFLMRAVSSQASPDARSGVPGASS